MKLDPPVPGRPYAIVYGSAGQSPADLPQDYFMAAYKTYGALLLRGFDMSLAAFADLTRQYCSGSIFNDSMGRDVLDAGNNIQTVSRGDRPFPLHAELAREPWRPDACFFYCIRAPSSGGETTICDGVEIVRHLPRDIYAMLRCHRLRYEQRMAEESCQYWLGTAHPTDERLAKPVRPMPYSLRRVNGKVYRSFTRPALCKPMFSDQLAFCNFLLFARFMNNRIGYPCLENGEPIAEDVVTRIKEVCDRLTAPIVWQPGDVVVLDNTRYMHGRNAIVDRTARLIASYFGYLKFAVPDAEEMADPPWRTGVFVPPSPRVTRSPTPD